MLLDYKKVKDGLIRCADTLSPDELLEELHEFAELDKKCSIMTIEDMKQKLNSKEYAFLRTNEHLNNHIILLTLAGSYANGTCTPESDLDVRGVALNSKREILLGQDFERFQDEHTDTVIYSFQRYAKLFCECNPNALELLGNRPEHYFHIAPEGQLLLDNKKLFLSRRCIDSYSGFISMQLRMLQNILARDTYTEEEKKQHIRNTMNRSMERLNHKVGDYAKVYINKQDGDIYISFKQDLDMPMRQVNDFMKNMTDIVRSFEKLNHRNRKKDEQHMNKHAMTLVRQYYNGIDLLEKGEIITYRPDEKELLMKIKTGGFMNPDGSYNPEFFELVDDLQKRFDYAKAHTSLPDKPDYKKIEDLIAQVHYEVVSRY